MNALFKSPYKHIFFIGLLIYLITAFFSEGYYQPDEHFQILEFANYKLSHTPAADLPWEFPERIRPALQPTLAWLIFKILTFIQISNPFTWTLILRIISALISWFIISKTCFFLIKDFSSEPGKKIFLYLSFFLWFMPFISVRFSSENFAGITFLGAVYLIIKYIDDISNKKLFALSLAGLLLGFSFFFRFQMAFAILGLGMWLVLINKVKLQSLFIIIISGLCSILFCIYLDYWFYGTVELTPLNYFVANIIENKAAHYGIFPWWSYFNFFILQAAPPISILLLLFFFTGLYKSPANIFTWCIVPFLIGHIIISHKEMRFMFPMIFSFIYMVSIGIDAFISAGKWKKVMRFLFILSVVVNIPLLTVSCITPSQGAISYYKFLYHYSSKKEATLFCKDKSIYNLAGFNLDFYKSPNVKCIIYHDDQEISDYLIHDHPDSVLLLERNISIEHTFAGYQNESIYCLYPQWVLHLNFNNWQARSRIWSVRELRKIE